MNLSSELILNTRPDRMGKKIKFMGRELTFNFLPHSTLRKRNKKPLKPLGSQKWRGGCSLYQFSQIGINKYTFLLVNCHRVQAWRLHSVIALFRVAFKNFSISLLHSCPGNGRGGSRPWSQTPLSHERTWDSSTAFPVDIQSSLCTLRLNSARFYRGGAMRN